MSTTTLALCNRSTIRHNYHSPRPLNGDRVIFRTFHKSATTRRRRVETTRRIATRISTTLILLKGNIIRRGKLVRHKTSKQGTHLVSDTTVLNNLLYHLTKVTTPHNNSVHGKSFRYRGLHFCVV